MKTSILAPWATLINRTHGTYERLYWLFWISLPTALTKRFRVPLWDPKMKKLLMSYRYQFFFCPDFSGNILLNSEDLTIGSVSPLFLQLKKKFVDFWRHQKATHSRVQGSPSKWKIFGDFCWYVFICVSYGSEFFTDAKLYIRRTLKIPWTLY